MNILVPFGLEFVEVLLINVEHSEGVPDGVLLDEAVEGRVGGEAGRVVDLNVMASTSSRMGLSLESSITSKPRSSKHISLLKLFCWQDL